MTGYIILGYATEFNVEFANAMCAAVYDEFGDSTISMNRIAGTQEPVQIIHADPYLMMNMGGDLK